ncbi:MAG TPA: hypothetical protein VGR02_00350 [Thermoanaerobaculia bacterium]|jgi:hypothetical protein|nr:hypothetical protein [Thermoanaerobaculia bacterium]
MLKRIVPLIVILAAFSAAPAAMAAVCYRCRVFPPDPCAHCRQVTFGTRYEDCFENPSDCTCELDIVCATAAASAATPALGSEYTVAAVERLDDGQPSPSTPLVASASLTQSNIH